jgi:Protein of unknown function (DUF2877)
VSPLLQELLEGPVIPGVAMSRRHIRFRDYVVSLTSPGRPRMPNGIVCDVDADRGVSMEIGRGVLRVGGSVMTPHELWNPRPQLQLFAPNPHIDGLDVRHLAGRGPGLTPAGDDLLAGYAAGLTLLHGLQDQAARIVLQAAPLTNSLSATLLLHAGRGEVPEPVHALLNNGDVGGLLHFGHTSGAFWFTGLVLAGYPRDRVHATPRAA